MAIECEREFEIADPLSARQPVEAALRHYDERFKLLHEIDQAILGARSPEAIALGALTRIRHLIPCQRVSVVAFDSDGPAQVLAVVTSPNYGAGEAPWLDLLYPALADLPRIQGATDLSLLTHLTPLQSAFLAAGARSYLIVPLLTAGDLLGTLNLEASQPDAFTAEHVDTAAGVAALLAIAIQQAQLRSSLQEELAERRLAQAALLARETALSQYASELQAQNAELDAFAHTVAHDLKNPLTSLLGFAELLVYGRDRHTDQQTEEYLHLIMQNAVKMTDIVDALLLLASVRQQDDVPMDVLDMSAIVAEVQRRLAPLAAQHQAQIILPKAWPVACGYGPWVEEVWANYIANGLQHGGRPPRLELGADLLPATAIDPAMVRFWVRDNGPGVAPDKQKLLFAPFARLGTPQHAGHGLGLSIVQRIIDRLGGQVGVESELGCGSLFYFTLPAAPDEARATTQKRARGTAPLPPP